METSLVATVIGPDKPGLVGVLSTIVVDHGGNWLESRMAHLAGQFAGIFHVEVNASEAEALTKSLKALSGKGLSVTVHSETEASSGDDLETICLELVGHDRPGIVSQLSNVLACHAVNVEELTTLRESAPWSGETLFRATASLRLPAGMSLETLQKEVESIASDLMVDISITPKEK